MNKNKIAIAAVAAAAIVIAGALIIPQVIAAQDQTPAAIETTVETPTAVPAETPVSEPEAVETPADGEAGQPDTDAAQQATDVTKTFAEQALKPLPAADGDNEYAYVGDVYEFASPSRNIKCNIYTGDDSTAICFLKEFDGNAQAIDPDSDDSSGPIAGLVEAGRGRAGYLSSGYYLDPNMWNDVAKAPVLDYGQKFTVEGFTCTSTTKGMTCDYDGHGFSVSRSKLTTW
ncbi:MAG: hypothetical protein LBR58_10410 [Propionibacteriaceae bacterium]|jgi:hypothetical protein|nr:hypothetical protein [Propionibacteriaceae bacterium]